jgi:hypothetical protein
VTFRVYTNGGKEGGDLTPRHQSRIAKRGRVTKLSPCRIYDAGPTTNKAAYSGGNLSGIRGTRTNRRPWEHNPPVMFPL